MQCSTCNINALGANVRYEEQGTRDLEEYEKITRPEYRLRTHNLLPERYQLPISAGYLWLHSL